jgi:hypothetical protein
MTVLRVGSVAASALLNVALLLVLRGGFGHMVIAMAFAVWLGIPGVLVGGSVYAVWHHSLPARRIGRGIVVFGAVCISGLISLAPGYWLVERDIAIAQRYCEALTVQLDDYKRVHGEYPPDLSQIRRDPTVPRLVIIGGMGYWSTGSTFALNINDPRGMMNWIGYSSTDRQWRRWH